MIALQELLEAPVRFAMVEEVEDLVGVSDQVRAFGHLFSAAAVVALGVSVAGSFEN